MFRPARSNDTKRQLVEFRSEIWQALFLLARDSGKTLEALADEAFTDLLRKHRRPLSLKEALPESARRLPANDDVPPKRHGTGRARVFSRMVDAGAARFAGVEISVLWWLPFAGLLLSIALVPC